ncbi:MAG: hypothetical protein LBE51_13570 [Acidovorax sp.]|jgi:prefoldin subunit 5|nr:hypothetical protein [Acidovorax sp.]
MEIQAVNDHLHSMKRSAEQLARNAAKTGGDAHSYMNAFQAQHDLLVLMCKEILELKQEVATLKGQQAPVG